jgi:hypothetical protein
MIAFRRRSAPLKENSFKAVGFRETGIPAAIEPAGKRDHSLKIRDRCLSPSQRNRHTAF